jgi:hypothetical protein
VLAHPSAPKQEPIRLHKRALMIIHVPADLKEISRLGRKYPWKRPDNCQHCGSMVWGHGYRDLYFAGYNEPIPIKRWRCPRCRCIIIYRPAGFFSRFQTPIQTIRLTICYRLQANRWPFGCSRTRCGHWLRALKRRTLAYLSNTWQNSLINAFDLFLSQGIVPVSRSI